MFSLLRIRLCTVGITLLVILNMMSLMSCQFGAQQRTMIIHEYTRFAEIEDQCSNFLSHSSAARLNFNTYQASNLLQELSFDMGDWWQDSGNAPLLPFITEKNDGQNVLAEQLPHYSSLTLNHFDRSLYSSYALNVSGWLNIGISPNSIINTAYGPNQYAEFRFWPGVSVLHIPFEGVYTESDETGERILCLLGNANLPSRDSNTSDPWKWLNRPHWEFHNMQAPFVHDDHILFIIRYPKSFTLRSRAVHGEMKSWNEPTSSKYFDKVELSSRLGTFSSYEFRAGELVSEACSPSQYPDGLLASRQFEMYNGTDICDILNGLSTADNKFRVMPNWNCNSTEIYCNALGPFAMEGDTKATNGIFNNVNLIIQDIRCQQRVEHNLMNVSAVLRVLRPEEQQKIAFMKTGLNDLTLSVEGIWNSSAGRLCMIGCSGVGDNDCNSRVCMYFATSFSIYQRSIVYGQISSINDNMGILYFPLSFELSELPHALQTKMNYLHTSTAYKYSKIELASAFLKRNEPFGFVTALKKSLLSYPKKGYGYNDMQRLIHLSNDLSLHSAAVLDPPLNDVSGRTDIQMEILTINSYFGGNYWSYPLANSPTAEIEVLRYETNTTDEQLLLNVSAGLYCGAKSCGNFSALYLEGIYNPVDGRMYLIGCRVVHASQKILFESKDLEHGLDCLIEVQVEYPPMTSRWLMNPAAKFTITSQRNEDDPLYFDPRKIESYPIMYAAMHEYILSQRGIEGILRVIILSVTIACIVSQLIYIRNNSAIIPYISLVMLGVQALGYSIPLITGAEALFTGSTTNYYNFSFSVFEDVSLFMIGYLVKMLVLGAFLLTLILFQKVRKYRMRYLLEPGRVPTDKRVLLICFGIHAVGFLVVLAVHFTRFYRTPIYEEQYVRSREYPSMLHKCGMQLKTYVGLIQDFFLLPQIIGNFFWRINCRPLRKTYYVGLTLVGIIPHLYGLRQTSVPVPNPNFYDRRQFTYQSLDFYTKFGHIVIPFIATLLVVFLYFQQRLKAGKKGLLWKTSRLYEKLLVSSVNQDVTIDNFRKGEE